MMSEGLEAVEANYEDGRQVIRGKTDEQTGNSTGRGCDRSGKYSEER
jgi:hypothetical protein